MRVIMLSDERIAEIAEDIYCSEGTRAEIEHSIRAALAEAAVCSQFKPGESGQVWEPVQVPVTGEAAGWICKNKGSRWFTESEDRRDIHISAGWEVTPLFEKPATCITQAELDAKDARIRDLEEYTSVSLTVGGGHVVYGSVDAIARAQMYVLLDSNHPVEAKDTARYFAGALQKAEAELDALRKSVRMTMQEASDLAMAMWRDFFQEASPNFGLCDSPVGVLSQLDNMYAGLRERIQLQNARIRELEFVIEEIIRINHYDFRGHEIAHAAIAKERQS